MATYYLSPTGNDTTGDGSLANPWKLPTKAEAVASDGDIVRLAAGIYEAATYHTFAKEIEWIGAGKDLTFLRGNNASRVIYLNSTKVKGFTDLSLDGDSSGSQPAYHFEGNGVDQATTFTRVGFVNGNTTGARIASSMRGISMIDCVFDVENEDQVIQLLGGITGFVLDGCVINVPAGIVLNAVIYQSAVVTSAVIRINENEINVLPNYAPIRLLGGGIDDLEITDNVIFVATNNTRSLIELKDIIGSCEISGNTITFESTWENCRPISLSSTVGTGEDCIYTIEDNVVEMSKSDGYGFLVGDEGGDILSKAGAFNGSIIRRNVMKAGPFFGLPIGNLHGIMMGGNKNIFFEQNFFYGAAYGAACKGQGEAWTDGYIRECVFVNCQYPVRQKGQKDIKTANCVFVGDNGDAAQCMAITDNTAPGTESTGSFTRNNIYQISSGYAIKTQDTSHVGMSHDYNCFFLTGTAKAGYINGVEYATLADMQAAGYDLNSIEGDPKLLDNYTVDMHSICFERGVPVAGLTPVLDVTATYEITFTGNAELVLDSPYKRRTQLT